MKLVIISDVHSNSSYLSIIQKKIEDEKADMIFFLGDAIGYYDNPNYILDWLRNINAQCIKGNHEKYFLDELNYNKENEKIYRVEENKINITNVNRNFVTTWSDMLDLTIDKKRFLFVHGDIKSSENHVYDITSIDKELFSRYDYYMFGHTHIPFVQYHNGCCIVNPGSIGQPRDYTQQPSYVVLDTNSLDISIKKIIVDVEGFCNQISLKSYNEKLINILKRENNE